MNVFMSDGVVGSWKTQQQMQTTADTKQNIIHIAKDWVGKH